MSKSLRLETASLVNFTDAKVYDSEGNFVGHIDEVVLKPQRKLILVTLGDETFRPTQSDIEYWHETIKAQINDGGMITCSVPVKIEQVNLDVAPVAFYMPDGEEKGMWLKKEDLDIKDIIE